jgi:hypothetical protein
VSGDGRGSDSDDALDDASVPALRVHRLRGFDQPTVHFTPTRLRDAREKRNRRLRCESS